MKPNTVTATACILTAILSLTALPTGIAPAFVGVRDPSAHYAAEGVVDVVSRIGNFRCTTGGAAEASLSYRGSGSWGATIALASPCGGLVDSCSGSEGADGAIRATCTLGSTLTIVHLVTQTNETAGQDVGTISFHIQVNGKNTGALWTLAANGGFTGVAVDVGKP